MRIAMAFEGSVMFPVLWRGIINSIVVSTRIYRVMPSHAHIGKTWEVLRSLRDRCHFALLLNFVSVWLNVYLICPV